MTGVYSWQLIFGVIYHIKNWGNLGCIWPKSLTLNSSPLDQNKSEKMAPWLRILLTKVPFSLDSHSSQLNLWHWAKSAVWGDKQIIVMTGGESHLRIKVYTFQFTNLQFHKDIQCRIRIRQTGIAKQMQTRNQVKCISIAHYHTQSSFDVFHQ